MFCTTDTYFSPAPAVATIDGVGNDGVVLNVEKSVFVTRPAMS